MKPTQALPRACVYARMHLPSRTSVTSHEAIVRNRCYMNWPRIFFLLESYPKVATAPLKLWGPWLGQVEVCRLGCCGEMRGPEEK